MTETKASSVPGTKHARILLVDDEEFLLDLIREILEEAGYEVTALANSSDAFRTFSAAPSEFDLIITDERMPELSGSDLLGQILEIRPDVPVILHTDYPNATSMIRARDIGARAILSKSFTMTQLVTSIRGLLER
jgi:DNA-binding NtrC family response regulator